MEKAGAMELIQQVKDYFKGQHGLTVTVRISAHDHTNKHITAKSAIELMDQISQEINGEPYVSQSDKYQWISASSRDCDVTIFYPEEPQTS
ncbi:hypothetical protein [Desulforamulus ruminis]|uniref:hypothetical protein n=1 Tax=Desulforamulus ruminis TaxID=1564 RepID=UPI002357DA7B|nr:hypothetical protein [Desulforamulus ruminis]